MDIQKNSFLSIEHIADQYLKAKNHSPVKTGNENDFQKYLNEEQNLIKNSGTDLKFSKHSCLRLAERNINLTDNQVERLKQGARKANEKGIKESLVMVDQFAFIVNVKNNTVITAMDQSSDEETIVTNIDGAVII